MTNDQLTILVAAIFYQGNRGLSTLGIYTDVHQAVLDAAHFLDDAEKKLWEIRVERARKRP